MWVDQKSEEKKGLRYTSEEGVLGEHMDDTGVFFRIPSTVDTEVHGPEEDH